MSMTCPKCRLPKSGRDERLIAALGLCGWCLVMARGRYGAAKAAREALKPPVKPKPEFIPYWT